MRLLILQFTDPRLATPLPRFSHALGLLSALLKADGFDVSLASMPGYRPELLRSAIVRHRPQYVLVDLTPYSVTAAHRSIVDISEKYSLHIAVCGIYATCCPTQAMSIPGVEALFIGEYEQSALEYFQFIRDESDPAGLPNVWVHGDGGLVKGTLSPLSENLDSLPMPDREIFDFARIAEETGEIGIKACRGCGRSCAYCVNAWYAKLYEDNGKFCRRRNPAGIMEEVSHLVLKYPAAKRIRFYDHAFMSDRRWLEEMADLYAQKKPLAYKCFADLSCVDRRSDMKAWS